MDSKRDCLIITCIIVFNNAWSSAFVHESQRNTYDTFDYYLYDYALNKLSNPHTGQLYSVPLPANLSGVELSFARLRTSSIWKDGVNYTSCFSIPPLALMPLPFTKRVDIIYQNLGNWSSSYYDVPNHTFVTPVIGFLAYDPNMTSKNYGPIELELTGKNPITVRFPNMFIRKDNITGAGMKCVRFDINGTLEFSNVTMDESACVVRKQGHFCLVIPNQPNKDRIIKRWMIVGVMGGFLVLVLVAMVCAVGCDKWSKRKRIKRMDKMSELSVALDTLWIGRSRVPLAPSTRTYPVVENSYVP